jgi:hypothetical protein
MLPQPRHLLDPFGRPGSTLIRMKIERSGWRALTPAATGIVVAMSGSTAMAKTFHLTISGDTDARYAGACVVTRASSHERIALEGAVPAERAFVADGLSCGLRAQGRIVVEITHDGSRSRAETSGGLVQISAR